jgi:hypothetical protein
MPLKLRQTNYESRRRTRMNIRDEESEHSSRVINKGEHQMKKIAPALSILLLSVACASMPMKSTDNGGAAGSATLIAKTSAQAQNYIAFNAPSQIRSVDDDTVMTGLTLKGTLTNKGFIPAGTIEGRGSFCAEGKDWLSLSDLRVHKASEGAPSGSYVLGCANANGSFSPASREIVAQ